ncbi:MAG: 50S ribosomal protein L21e [Candidatus Woesearchaeota archaeon]|jgi:ribosomal protein L21E
MKRIGGSRRKTRCKMTKPVKARGKISLKSYFQTFTAGDKVALKIEPAYQNGMFYRRFYGLIGTVIKKMSIKKDSCYEILVNDSGKDKKVIVHPVHLKKIEVGEKA